MDGSSTNDGFGGWQFLASNYDIIEGCQMTTLPLDKAGFEISADLIGPQVSGE